MPRHEFQCGRCESSVEVERSFAEGAPDPFGCECGGLMEKVWVAPLFSTIGCSGASDPNEIPPTLSVTQNPLGGTSKAKAAKLEAAYQRDLAFKRRNIKSSQGSVRMTHSIPAELFHGKIRQTGDKSYWDDPKNRKRHDSMTRVQ